MLSSSPPVGDFPAYTIGVTGHMDLNEAETERLKGDVRNFFLALKGELKEKRENYLPKDFPALTHTKLILLSSLAPGADTLVAEVALDLGIEVRAPLPYPEDIYLESTSFQWKSVVKGKAKAEGHDANDIHLPSVEKFKSLKNKLAPDLRWQVRLHGEEEPPDAKEIQTLKEQADGKHDGPTEPSAVADKRRQRYAAAGEYVANHCNILIAVWDRTIDNANQGGSCATAVGKLEGFVPGALPNTMGFAWDQAGAVARFYCQRSSNTKPVTQPAKPVEWLYPGDLRPLVNKDSANLDAENTEERRKRYETRVVNFAIRLNDFNKHAQPDSREIYKYSKEKQIRERIDYETMEAQTALGKSVYEAFGDDAREAFDHMGKIRRRAANATTAISNHTEKTHRSLFMWGGLSAVALHLWAHCPLPFQGFHIFLLGSAIFFAFKGWQVHTDYEESELESRDHDWRVLAEGLRVQLFWAAAGIDRSVAASYMQRQRGELDWIRKAISSIASPYHRWKDWFNKLGDSNQVAALKSVKALWLTEQKKYFINQTSKNDHKQHTLHELTSLLVISALVLAVLCEGIRDLPNTFLAPSHADALSPTWFAWFLIGAWAAISALLVVAGIVCNRLEFRCDDKTKLKDPLKKDKSAFWRGTELVIHRLFPMESQTEYSRTPKLDSLLRNRGVSIAIRFTLAFVIAVPILSLSELLHVEGEKFVAAVKANNIRFPGCGIPLAAHHDSKAEAKHVTEDYQPLNHYCVLGVGILILAGAFAVAWRETQMYAEHARQYHTMAGVFTSAEDRMERLITLLENEKDSNKRRDLLQKMRSLLVAVGREALDENAEWLILHRARPLEPVHG